MNIMYMYELDLQYTVEPQYNGTQYNEHLS